MAKRKAATTKLEDKMAALEIKKKAAKKKNGAPGIDYDEEIGRMICAAVSCSTDNQDKILSAGGFPTRKVVNRWRIEVPSFGAAYTRAKQIQAELYAEEIIDIIDNGTNDWMETLPDGDKPAGWKINGEHVQRSRARVDARKWLACKLAPKLYGEKQVVESHTYTHEDGLKKLK